MVVDGFRNIVKRVSTARENRVPLLGVAVPGATALLLVANLGLLFRKYPRAAAIGVIVFFLGTTPVIHDFWTMDGEERASNESNFQKNLALLGRAIFLLARAQADVKRRVPATSLVASRYPNDFKIISN